MRALTLFLIAAFAFPRALGAAEAALDFEPIPGEKSGLTHKLNADPALGKLETPYLGPLVDLNNDGHVDIHWYGHSGGGAAFFFGDGPGHFNFCGDKYADRWAFHAFSPLWWDVSGTGRLDCAASWATTGFFLNDGQGHFKKLNDSGLGLLVDPDGSGVCDAQWVYGQGLIELDPKPSAWGGKFPEKLAGKLAWKAEDKLGWPDGEQRSPHPLAPKFGAAYSVDLDGDNKNELIVTFHGAKLYAWVLERDPAVAGPGGWKEATEARGLPKGAGHFYFPEDLNNDGALDLLDLASGEVYLNNGKGHFAKADYRIFDPATRKGGAPFDDDGRFELRDLDNDGHQDLVSANFHGTACGLFMNRGGRFEEVKAPFPLMRVQFAIGDVDGDGALDVVYQKGDMLELLHNKTANLGLTVHVVPKAPALQQLGCKLWVYKAGQLGKPEGLLHYRQCFMERGNTNDMVLDGKLHVGLGKEETVDIRVRFPSGEVRESPGAKAKSIITLKE